MNNHNKMLAYVLRALLIFLPSMALAQDVEPPIQVDVRIPIKSHRGLGGRFEQQIAPGPATISGRVYNLSGGQTSLVTLQFDYRSRAEFALDEIIARIVIAIEDLNGQQLSIAIIDPNTINLNPNRVPLYYSATLYNTQGDQRQDYIAHVQVFGNYE